jgi:PEGA domain-containing protein
MSPLKRLRVPMGIAALLIVASSAPSDAQIWFPAYPSVRYATPDTSVRFDVKPKDAAVYVDGFYAGIVDDFDGVFQRLHTAPGGHEITLYLAGYRTYSERAYLSPNRTFKIHHLMEKLAAGDVAERPPAPAVAPPDEPQGPPPQRGPVGRQGPSPRYPPPPPNAPPPPPSSAQARTAARGGTLELNLQPPDADVLVDGQPSRGSVQERLTIDLSEGRHNIQVRKPGYVGYLTDVQIRRGETTSLDVNLRTQP